MVETKLTIQRGDKVSKELLIPGDITTRKLSFGVKADLEIDSDRLIQKRNTLYGGSDDELTANYDSVKGKTTVTIFFDKEDTADFTNDYYYYDLISQDADDSDDEITVAKDLIKIDKDVQTPFDGTNLPSSATRYVNLDASEAEAGDLIQCQLVDGVKTFVLITIEDLKTQLGIE